MKKFRALLARQPLTPLTKVAGFTSLVAAVVGEEIKGSWWGHPKGKEIFRIASELEDAGDVIVLKLLDGKQTFVDASLFAALYRVVTDRSWRAARSADGDDALLERPHQEHSASGKHVTVREPWSKWASATVKADAKKLTFDEAYDALRIAGRGRLTLPGK